MSAIGGSSGGGTALGRSTRSERATQHAIAARNGNAMTRAELQAEAGEHGYKNRHRMGVEFLEEKKAAGWPTLTEDENARFSSAGSGGLGEGEWGS